MAWRSSGSTNQELIENMCNAKIIKDERVKAAFLKVDRAHYSPRNPYEDSPQHIGHEATISAPHMHANAIQSLIAHIAPSEANPAPRVLDIGSGSGYLTHVIAELVGARGTVVGVEHIPQLRDLAVANMSKSAEGRAFLDSGRVKFRVGDGRKGWVEPDAEIRDVEREVVGARGKGWDVIHVGASAVTLHPELVEQLRAPGMMFIPVDDEDELRQKRAGGPMRVGQHIWVVEKDETGEVRKFQRDAVWYVPLKDAPK